MELAPDGPASRPGGPADEILGVRPNVVFAPSTEEEAIGLLGELARAGHALAFAGGGTELDLGNSPERLDALVRTERLARVREHAPADQIVVAEAGVRLAGLQRALAVHRQRLAIDPPWPDRATLGGIVASNAFGPLRTRSGSLRDLIIGISLVRADGTPARGGGKVVKNVAGFDLPKLMVGSLGTLGLITTVTFRLHPIPERVETVLLSARTAAEIRSILGAARDAQLELAAAAAMGSGARLDLALRFEGFETGVRRQTERLLSLVSASGGGPCDVLDQAAGAELWARHDGLRTAGNLRVKIAALPSAIETIVGQALPSLAASLEAPALVWYPTIGVGFVTGSSGDADRTAVALASARRVLASLGGSLVIQTAPAAVRSSVEVWGDPPRAIGLARSVKSRLDPDRRLAPGRFVGGI